MGPFDLPGEIRSVRFEAIVLPHLDGAYNLARWLVRNIPAPGKIGRKRRNRPETAKNSCGNKMAARRVYLETQIGSHIRNEAIRFAG
jgi:hypothetical protein